jgi:asparagine synthase (glutamine-hydrolysing)
LATHLSSGWDSNAVTATAARLLAGTDARVLAFTSVPRAGCGSNVPFSRIGNEGDIAAETAALFPNVEHNLVAGSAASPLADLDLYLEAFDRPLYSLCNFVWLTAIREQARERGARVLLSGELGNWSISMAPYTLLADLIRQGRWREWWREARTLRKNRTGRLRGIAANSFGPWLPAPLWRSVQGLSSRAEDRAYSAIHPRLRGHIARERERQRAGLAWRPKNLFHDTIRALATYDYGELRKGTLAGWGVDERDPTSDRRLIEFCLSMPIEMLLKDGVRRPLAHAALSDRLPPAVLDQKRKGYQAADWHEGMTADRKTIADLIDRIASSPLAASVIDVPSLRQWVRDWPQDGWEDPHIMARYRNALLGALSAGHFILSADA